MKSQKPPRGTLLNKSHPLARGLVGCWLMNEGTGKRIFDYSGNKNHGLMTNMDPTTDWKAGPHGWALNFGGTDDCIIVTDSDRLSGDSGLTISVWIKTGALDDEDGDIIAKYVSTGDQRSWSLGISGNKIQFYCSADGTADTTVSYVGATNLPSNGSWTHILARWNGSNIIIFINGVEEIYSAVAIGAVYNSSAPLYIARASIRAYYIGDISCVSIYDRSLSPAEIAWLYREPYAMFKHIMHPFKEVKKIYSRGGATR